MDHSPYQPKPLRHGELGPLLRALRERRGLTLRQAAEELGVSVSAISQAERGVPAVERLALRAVNGHLARAAETGDAGPGRVRLEFRAYGAAKDALTEIRGPETDRRAGLLRQALLARGFSLDVGASRARVRVADVSVVVDLDDMFASVARLHTGLDRPSARAGEPLGYVVDPDDDALDDEAWARDIDRFAGALAEAATGERFDADVVRRALRRRPPGWLSSAGPDTPAE